MLLQTPKKIVSIVLLFGLLLTLSVPTLAAPAMQAACEGATYSVQANDWLSKLADKNYGDVLAYPQIVDATNAAAQADASFATIDNPDIIEIGWQLCIPGVSDVEESAMAEKDIVDIAVADGRFNTLVAAVTAAGLVDALKSDGPFTVFAPTDDAFAALPEGTVEGLLQDIPALTDVLLYHVVAGNVKAAEVVGLSAAPTVQGSDVKITVEGDTVKINEATVIITDIEASNGTIHVIDAVILPPSGEEEAAMADNGEESAMAEKDIVDIAVADGRFNTLVAAVTAADLVDTLKGDGPFTVFAPTDDAFAALPEGTVDALLQDIPGLTNVLLYHVVSGKVMAADVVGLSAATTVQGSDVAVTVEGDTVKINEATVIITDIEASNGVIHVLDAVILPPAE